jgi:hypothetical protein
MQRFKELSELLAHALRYIWIDSTTSAMLKLRTVLDRSHISKELIGKKSILSLTAQISFYQHHEQFRLNGPQCGLGASVKTGSSPYVEIAPRR